jgi:phage tail-like protein
MKTHAFLAGLCSAAVVALAAVAHAQHQGNQDSLGVHARVFHLNDTGVVLTEQLRVGSQFRFEIDGVMVAGVHKIDGIEHENEVVEYRDGDDAITHTRPGRQKPGRMTVTKDWSNTPEWYRWVKAVLDGKVQRKSISIVFQSDAGEETRLNFFECWPTKWTGPALNAKTSAHASESIEIVFERMEMK